MDKFYQCAASFLLILFYSISYCQNANVIYKNGSMVRVDLKNGRIYKGVVIEQIPNQSIQIQTKTGNKFIFKQDEIGKINDESNAAAKSDDSNEETDKKYEGFINITEVNYCPEVGGTKDPYSFGFRTLFGYHRQRLSRAIGIGIERYRGATILPITLDVRNIPIKKVSPTIDFNFGYDFMPSDLLSARISSDGGWVFNPSVGLQFIISKNMAYLVNIGLKWQSIGYTTLGQNQFWQPSNTSGTYISSYYIKAHQYFATISTGFSFK